MSRKINMYYNYYYCAPSFTIFGIRLIKVQLWNLIDSLKGQICVNALVCNETEKYKIACPVVYRHIWIQICPKTNLAKLFSNIVTKLVTNVFDVELENIFCCGGCPSLELCPHGNTREQRAHSSGQRLLNNIVSTTFPRNFFWMHT